MEFLRLDVNRMAGSTGTLFILNVSIWSVIGGAVGGHCECYGDDYAGPKQGRHFA
jgi:hypothetical protein